MDHRTLGTSGPVVSAIGLGGHGDVGCLWPADRGESIATIHAALEAGVTLIDTGDFYGMGHNEMLIAEALKRRGATRSSSASSSARSAARTARGSASMVAGGGEDRRAYTLKRLGTDYIDIYRPARLDPRGADRGDGRRHRGHDRCWLRPPSRPLGGRARDHPAR